VGAEGGSLRLTALRVERGALWVRAGVGVLLLLSGRSCAELMRVGTIGPGSVLVRFWTVALYPCFTLAARVRILLSRPAEKRGV
jgi:hypothetical protein